MKIIAALLLFVFHLIPMQAHASAAVKVAILDNLQREKLSSEKYQKDYLEGIEAAAKETLGLGLKIEWKTFFYGKEPLAILEKVKDLKKWDHDIVIGPHSSNHFLMLRNEFKDTLVLSCLNELSLEEIAKIEKCSLGTVKSRIFRGKQLLRKLLTQKGVFQNG